MKTIIIISDYFGIKPKWFDMYIESCRLNPTIRWCIYTDCPTPEHLPPNVSMIHISFKDYCAHVSRRLGVSFTPHHPYNLCNLRPMLGVVHADLIAGFDYFGWSDNDIIYGDIRAFLGNEALSHNVISTHSSICVGHFTLLKNASWLSEAYLNIRGWRERLENPSRCDWWQSLDEAHLTALFAPDELTRAKFTAATGTSAPNESYFSNNYFAEQWSTPFIPEPWVDGRDDHPDTWFWQNGRLHNKRDGDREFMYLHLMNFKSSRWINERLYGSAPTWEQLGECMTFSIDDLHNCRSAARRVRIDRQGLHLD